MARDYNIPLGAYSNPFMRCANQAKFMYVDRVTGQCTIAKKYGKKIVCADSADCSSCTVPLQAGQGLFGEPIAKNKKGNR